MNASERQTARPAVRAVPRSARTANLQAAQRRWIEAIAADRQLSKSALAKGADVQPSTLTRLFSPGYTGLLSPAVIEAIATTYHVPPPPMGGEPEPARVGFGEAETLDFQAIEPAVSRMVRAAIDGRNAVDPWIMKSDALEAAGILAGDIMIVDLNATPQDGDACCLQVLDPYPALRGRTVWRVYTQGFYVPARLARHQVDAPLVAGGPGVVLRGVVTGVIRPHRLAMAHALRKSKFAHLQIIICMLASLPSLRRSFGRKPMSLSVSPFGRPTVTRAQIAAALQYSPSYGERLITVLMRDHGFPAPLPGTGRWSAAAVDAWIATARGARPVSPFDRAAVPGVPASSPEMTGHQAAPAQAGLPRSAGLRPLSTAHAEAEAATRRAFAVIEGGRHG